jgi:hypothetical protein
MRRFPTRRRPTVTADTGCRSTEAPADTGYSSLSKWWSPTVLGQRCYSPPHSKSRPSFAWALTGVIERADAFVGQSFTRVAHE